MGELDAARERLAVERLRLERAHADYLAALAQHEAEWRENLAGALGKSEVAARKALARFVEAEQARAELRAARTWLDAFAVEPRRAFSKGALLRFGVAVGLTGRNGDAYPIPAVLDALAAYLDDTTVAAERERQAEREQAEQAAQERRQQQAALREASA